MFTGIIQKVGKITSVRSSGQGKIFKINTCLPDIKIGDSISVNGVCLTVQNIDKDNFEVYASQQTLRKTNLQKLIPNSNVNLELAMRFGDKIGGHLVYGHVDGLAKLLNKKLQGDSFYLSFSIPQELNKYLIKNGNLAINGVSLTIANIRNNQFDVVVVPYTIKNTTLGKLKIGESVNVEIDIISKYINCGLSRK